MIFSNVPLYQTILSFLLAHALQLHGRSFHNSAVVLERYHRQSVARFCSGRRDTSILKQNQVNNANSEFILINLLISLGCRNGSIGQGGPDGQGGSGGVRGLRWSGGKSGQGGQPG